MNDHIMKLIDLGRILTKAAGELSVASGWVQEKEFPQHYRERAAELEDLASRLSLLLADFGKLTDNDPELLGTTTEMRKKIFSSVKIGYSVVSGKN